MKKPAKNAPKASAKNAETPTPPVHAEHIDSAAMLDAATYGQPDGPTSGPDPEESQTDELLTPGFNNPIDDNNR
ncbi:MULTISPECIES: hypothetical protein [Hymenobacter]|uniref:Uncharacterized protein n=1 Tax=Hymenobacter jejuensis TaxID=2502781 RepID=A0A5B7ZX12_9BACT|nr:MULTISPECIES: hypothetical protein [Hymenobacter]MBC6988657.1 hypothetical protein [Hymenobacter sp. BT491]QDA59046.1 hypothetical protein FHG12_02520 [Hymenobacter jejuensis]